MREYVQSHKFESNNGGKKDEDDKNPVVIDSIKVDGGFKEFEQGSQKDEQHMVLKDDEEFYVNND